MRNTGVALEDEVFRLVDKLRVDGALPYQPALSRLHRRKKYYSPERKRKVAFENVLEVYMKDNIDQPGAQPTHVVIFECKDHRRNVEVGQVDEIVAKLKGSFGFSMKAYLVTRHGFSAGAINTARSNGIGLIKLIPPDKVIHIAYMATLNTIREYEKGFAIRAMRALQDSAFVSQNETFYGLDGHHVFRSLESMIAHGTDKRRRTRGDLSRQADAWRIPKKSVHE